MSKKAGIVLSGFALFVVILFAVGAFLVHKEDKKMELKGNVLVEKIEKFRTEHQRLPASVQEMGLQEHEWNGPFYIRIDSLEYKVIFSIGFDHEYAYFSKTRNGRGILNRHK